MLFPIEQKGIEGPRLNDLQARSRRVSAEIIGRSALGRDLYLVTVTAPESPAETRRQHAWRALIENDPVRVCIVRSKDGVRHGDWVCSAETKA